MEHYAEDIKFHDAAAILPDPDSLSDCKDTKYTYKHSYDIFDTYGLALFAEYSGEDYESKKEEALDSYDFPSKDVFSVMGYMTLYAKPVSCNGYTFRALPAGNNPDYTYNDYACKSFGYVGYNDEERKIAYFYFYDPDRDEIAEKGSDAETAVSYLLTEYIDW